jgi:hypothetical protein
LPAGDNVIYRLLDRGGDSFSLLIRDFAPEFLFGAMSGPTAPNALIHWGNLYTEADVKADPATRTR